VAFAIASPVPGPQRLGNPIVVPKRLPGHSSQVPWPALRSTRSMHHLPASAVHRIPGLSPLYHASSVDEYSHRRGQRATRCRAIRKKINPNHTASVSILFRGYQDGASIYRIMSRGSDTQTSIYHLGESTGRLQSEYTYVIWRGRIQQWYSQRSKIVAKSSATHAMENPTGENRSGVKSE